MSATFQCDKCGSFYDYEVQAQACQCDGPPKREPAASVPVPEDERDWGLYFKTTPAAGLHWTDLDDWASFTLTLLDRLTALRQEIAGWEGAMLHDCGEIERLNREVARLTEENRKLHKLWQESGELLGDYIARDRSLEP